MMLTKIYEENPSEKELKRVVEALEQDGLVVYPTDSVYAVGCALHSAKGVEQLARIKGTAPLTVVFDRISRVAEYCRVDNATFKILKRNLPGAFTFILKASSRVPAKTLGKRKTIGVRIPKNEIVRRLVEELDAPLASASVWDADEPEYMTDPELIAERYARQVAMVVDGGLGREVPTTVVDLTGDEIEILRQGAGELQ